MKRLLISFLILAATINAIETPKPLSSPTLYQRTTYHLFSGSSNCKLSHAIAKELGTTVGKSLVTSFNDGEISIKIDENVRNKDIYLIQSTCTTDKCSINDSLMELYLTVRALRRASAKSVTAIIPYYGYARQDRKSAPRVPISAAEIALMFETAGVDRVVSVDLHCGQIQGFFQHIPVDNLYAATLTVPYFAQKILHKPVILSPDAGGVSRAKYFRDRLARYGVETGFGIIVKQRQSAGIVGSMDLVGDVQDRDVIIVDDLCDTGGTLVKAAAELKKFGARNIYASITHPVFSKNALEKIKSSDFKEVVVTDTIPIAGKFPANLTQISIAPLIAEVIYRLQTSQSLAEVFE